MTLALLSGLVVTPTEVRITAGILCVVVIAIIILRRKRMAAKRRPIS